MPRTNKALKDQYSEVVSFRVRKDTKEKLMKKTVIERGQLSEKMRKLVESEVG